jgi:hypothetical protein
MNALKLRELPLSKGAHQSPEEGMCVMEVVSYVAGEPFSDHPRCACPVISNFLRLWNDSLNDEDRQMLKQLVPLLINSRGSCSVEQNRIKLISEWYFRVHAPAFLDLAGLSEYAEDGRKNGERANWYAARNAARDAARDAALLFVGYAVGYAAGYAAREAAALSATGEAALCATGYAARCAASNALRHTVVMLQKSALQLMRDCLAIKD